MKKENWGYYPTKNHFEIFLKNSQKKSEAFRLGLPNLEEVTKHEQDNKNVFIVVHIMLWFSVKSFLRY
jgi:hypothetical protein